MNTDTFWSIIEQASGDADEVTTRLTQLSLEDITGFYKLYRWLHDMAYSRPLWGAAHLILGGCCSPWEDTYRAGCSDDSFDYFRDWLIGKGRLAYEAALRNPDELEPFITQDDLQALCGNEPLNYAAANAYERRGGDRQQLESMELETPAGDLGESTKEEDLPHRFPALGRRFAPRYFEESTP